MTLSLFPLSEEAITIEFGEKATKEVNQRVHEAARKISQRPFSGFIECVPTFTSLTIYYNPIIAGNFDVVCKKLLSALSNEIPMIDLNQKIHRVPVCYDVEFAPDLLLLSQSLNLSQDEIIELHTKPLYDVYFLGFSAGFPFLGGLSAKLFHPRRLSPRLKVPAGSVGIAGSQTGVYPIETPGGWQIIGRTPLRLFNYENNPPVLVKPGDQVRFYPISKEDFFNMEAQNEH